MRCVISYIQVQANTNLDQTLNFAQNQTILKSGLYFRIAFTIWLVFTVLGHANGLQLQHIQTHTFHMYEFIFVHLVKFIFTQFKAFSFIWRFLI